METTVGIAVLIASLSGTVGSWLAFAARRSNFGTGFVCGLLSGTLCFLIWLNFEAHIIGIGGMHPLLSLLIVVIMAYPLMRIVTAKIMYGRVFPAEAVAHHTLAEHAE